MILDLEPQHHVVVRIVRGGARESGDPQGRVTRILTPGDMSLRWSESDKTRGARRANGNVRGLLRLSVQCVRGRDRHRACPGRGAERPDRTDREGMDDATDSWRIRCPFGRARSRLPGSTARLVESPGLAGAPDSAMSHPIGFASRPISSGDPFLFHKTTHRAAYESRAAENPDLFDVHVTEFTRGKRGHRNRGVRVDAAPGVRVTPGDLPVRAACGGQDSGAATQARPGARSVSPLAHQLGPRVGRGAAARIALYHTLSFTDHALSSAPSLVGTEPVTKRNADMELRARTGKKTVWGWALYEFGSSAFFAVIVSFTYGVFFRSVAARGSTVTPG